MASSKPDENSEAPRFEERLEKLETIVSALESGELGLEDTLARYEEGVGVVRELTRRLEEAEARIETLDEASDDAGDDS